MAAGELSHRWARLDICTTSTTSQPRPSSRRTSPAPPWPPPPPQRGAQRAPQRLRARAPPDVARHGGRRRWRGTRRPPPGPPRSADVPRSSLAVGGPRPTPVVLPGPAGARCSYLAVGVPHGGEAPGGAGSPPRVPVTTVAPLAGAPTTFRAEPEL
jgi:hypothetical protein